MKKILFIFLAFILAFGLVGCGQSKENEKVDIRGEITSLSQGTDNKVTFIMVEGKLESDTAYDKASVSITDKTKILDKDTGKRLSRIELQKGMRLEVVIEGPVRESYPVQCDAKEVRVLK